MIPVKPAEVVVLEIIIAVHNDATPQGNERKKSQDSRNQDGFYFACAHFSDLLSDSRVLCRHSAYNKDTIARPVPAKKLSEISSVAL